jgi:hypothetical protein
MTACPWTRVQFKVRTGDALGVLRKTKLSPSRKIQNVIASETQGFNKEGKIIAGLFESGCLFHYQVNRFLLFGRINNGWTPPGIHPIITEGTRLSIQLQGVPTNSF